MTIEGIELERRGQVAVVTFNRPDRMNSFNEHMWDELERVVSDLKGDLPRAVVVTGAGDRAFCAGFDVNPDNPQISGLIEAVLNHERAPVERMIRRIRTAVDGLVFLPVPVIAALNGIAFGGGAELALRCDIRIADPTTVISFSEVRLGLMPDWGGGVALTRVAGPAVAADLVLSARRVGAEEALRLGIINRISGPGMAREEALELGQVIAKQGPRAVRHALRVIRRTPDLPIEDALDLETEEAVTLIASGECYHGIEAFLSKKDARFPDPDR
ncbi:MAG: enoyl-CoA hydratase/isomerase family protein [Deltaproteobacteria bacterium]|nr:enoyl-CoA hydratase/isomerase family protein [Deltaproteobacteria bacterium]